MISFPVLNELHVDNYALYPGSQEAGAGLHVTFEPGTTLIIGANGLGKTTLISIIYRLLTGPFDISGLSDGNTLGNRRLDPVKMGRGGLAAFRQRVLDNATEAKAKLIVSLNTHIIEIERSLYDLTLMSLVVDQNEIVVKDESVFQETISRLAGVWAFGDWILMLRHLTFYFEDRRSLVWDPTAQRQILRFLFLSPEAANQWSIFERKILEQDSRARNLQNVLNREAQELSNSEHRLGVGSGVVEQIESFSQLQAIDFEERNSLELKFAANDVARVAARERLLIAEQDREASKRDAERAKLLAVDASFPAKTDTARFIFSQILANSECLVCGTEVPLVAAALNNRIDAHQCVVCGSPQPQPTTVHPIQVAVARVDRSATELSKLDQDMLSASQDLAELGQERDEIERAITMLDTMVSERALQISKLSQSLPPDESQVLKLRDDLSAMRARLIGLQTEVRESRAQFSDFVELHSREMASRAEDICASFGDYAQGFLFEDCHLIWSPVPAQLGQEGIAIQFPAFEVRMGGSDFPSMVKRRGPDQVSESQREFIDLAFRMALIKISGWNECGSLILDAPESSLDSVFAVRAAIVLARFSNANDANRLIVTSNVIEGQLLPSLLGLSTTPASMNAHFVNLFSIAEPTAAIRSLASEYQISFENIITKAREISSSHFPLDQAVDSPIKGAIDA